MKTGKTASNSLFLFRYISQKQPKYAFVAPKTIAKEASSRNKLRRQGYNSLRVLPLPQCAGIFFFKKQAKLAQLREIKEGVTDIIDKIHPK